MLRCYVTDRKRADILSCARRAVQGGVDFIQVREKDLDGRLLLEAVARILEVVEGSGTRVLVNDRLDVALAAGAHGVHLPSAGLPAVLVRPLIGLMGVSTHSRDEARAAQDAGADYVIFGPVFDTPGKSGVGLGRLREVTAAVRTPVLAIGGVTAGNAAQVADAGAAGIAAIRMFQESDAG